MIQEDSDLPPKLPGYKHVTSDRFHSSPLVGGAGVLSWLSESAAVVVTREGSTTVDLSSTKGRAVSCLDVAIAAGRPEVIVGLKDKVVAVSGARSSPVSFVRPVETDHDHQGVDCVMVSWVPGTQCDEFLAVYSDGAVARVLRKQSDDCKIFDSQTTMKGLVSSERITAAAVSPCLDADGRCVVALASSKGRLHLVDANSGSLLGGMSTFFGGFTCVSFSSDGSYLAAGGEDDMVTLWRIGSASAVHCQGHTSWPSACAFETASLSPDIRFWSVGTDGKVCVFEVKDEDFPLGQEDQVGDARDACQFVPKAKSRADLYPIAPVFCAKISGEPLTAIGIAEGGLLAISTKRMVMQFSALPAVPLPKKAALLRIESAVLFQKQWHVYKTVLENNDLCHRDTIESIARDFAGRVAGGVAPRRLLDIGCGDGAVLSAVLKKLQKDGLDVKLAHYTGVDASRAALDLNVVPADTKSLEEMELEQYLESTKDGAYDAILANLILHHFDENGKRRLVRQIAGLLNDNGVFYWGDVYDTRPGEGRKALLARWKERMGKYKGLSPEELRSVWEHVAEKDFPASLPFMVQAMEDAGLVVEVVHDDRFYYVLLRGTKPL